jgi:hypothetical protein
MPSHSEYYYILKNQLERFDFTAEEMRPQQIPFSEI